MPITIGSRNSPRPRKVLDGARRNVSGACRKCRFARIHGAAAGDSSTAMGGCARAERSHRPGKPSGSAWPGRCSSGSPGRWPSTRDVAPSTPPTPPTTGMRPSVWRCRGPSRTSSPPSPPAGSSMCRSSPGAVGRAWRATRAGRASSWTPHAISAGCSTSIRRRAPRGCCPARCSTTCSQWWHRTTCGSGRIPRPVSDWRSYPGTAYWRCWASPTTSRPPTRCRRSCPRHR